MLWYKCIALLYVRRGCFYLAQSVHTVHTVLCTTQDAS